VISIAAGGTSRMAKSVIMFKRKSTVLVAKKPLPDLRFFF
jgi:hypothetical protein